jgi:UDP-N-acetylglucosamine kinase
VTVDIGRLAREKVLPSIFGEIQPVASGIRPTLVLLGGQPAAGKSGTQDAITARHQDMAAITGDEFRMHHPKFITLARADPLGMPNTTSAVAGPLVRRCLDHALGIRYDVDGQPGLHRAEQYSVLLEGVFSDSDMVLSTIEEFAKAGFDVHAYAMAVPEHLSRLSAENRFLRSETPYQARWTPPTAHDRSYSRLPDTLRAVERSERVSHIEVWTRTGPIYVGDRRGDGTWPGSAVDHIIAGRRAPLDIEAWTRSYGALRRVAEQRQIPQLPGFAPVPYLADARVQGAWKQLDDHAARLGEPHQTLPPALSNPRDLARASFPVNPAPHVGEAGPPEARKARPL